MLPIVHSYKDGHEITIPLISDEVKNFSHFVFNTIETKDQTVQRFLEGYQLSNKVFNSIKAKYGGAIAQNIAKPKETDESFKVKRSLEKLEILDIFLEKDGNSTNVNQIFAKLGPQKDKISMNMRLSKEFLVQIDELKVFFKQFLALFIPFFRQT